MLSNDHEVDIDEYLRRQDDAMALLERLRIEEPSIPKMPEHLGGGRRQFRRWPMPPGVTIELHDGNGWQPVNCSDMGIGGARLDNPPHWINGPTPARLKAPNVQAILVLSDVVWRDAESSTAGLSFDFLDQEERDLWAAALIDALLSRYALQ